MAQRVRNPTSIHEDSVAIPRLAQWVEDPALQTRVAVAVVQAGSSSSDSTPSLGTSICCRCSPKKEKGEKMSVIPLLNFNSCLRNCNMCTLTSSQTIQELQKTLTPFASPTYVTYFSFPRKTYYYFIVNVCFTHKFPFLCSSFLLSSSSFFFFFQGHTCSIWKFLG